MSAAHDPVGLAEGRALLTRLPEYFLVALRGARLERHADNAVRCSFELPLSGRRTKVAPTAPEAIHAMLHELSDVLIPTAPQKRTKTQDQRSMSKEEGVSVLESKKAGRFHSKIRQFTIGVTLPVTLKKSLLDIAEHQSTSFADVARQLVTVGYDDFDDLSFSEASSSLLSRFSSEVGRWLPSNTEQVMLRLDPPLAVRIRSSAKEYRKSASEFGAMCLAHGFVLQMQLFELEQKVAAFRGSAGRKLAPQVGLGAHVTLLSGILAGSVLSPKQVLKQLSEVFEASEFVLTEFFRKSFETRGIPAFKAEGGKPSVARKVSTWGEAVKSLNLPEEQVKELLRLDE